jgi:hypothetical protein
MNRQRDIERVLETWFVDGANQMPDRVYLSILDQVDRQAQRPAWRLQPWRFPTVNTPLKLVLIGAALIVALAAGSVLIAGGRGAGPVATPTPSPTPTPTPTATPTSEASGAPEVRAGALAAGIYRLSNDPWSAVDYEFTVPNGWTAGNGGQTIGKHSDQPTEMGIIPFVVDRIMDEPCGPDIQTAIGPTADDLVTALLAQRGPVAKRSDITVAGLPGTRVELTYPAGLDPASCEPPIGLQIWQDRTGDGFLVLGEGMTIRVDTADVDGARFVITSSYQARTSATDIAELDTVLSSIRLLP